MFPQFFIHSSDCGHIDCFFVLAVINKAAGIMRCSYLFDIVLFVSFDYIPRSGSAGSFGFYFFKCLRKLHTVFHSGRTSLRCGHQL